MTLDFQKEKKQFFVFYFYVIKKAATVVSFPVKNVQIFGSVFATERVYSSYGKLQLNSFRQQQSLLLLVMRFKLRRPTEMV